MQLFGQFQEPDHAVCAGDDEAAGEIFDVADGGFQQMRCDLLAALDNHARGFGERRAHEHHRTRTAAAAAETHAVAVAFHDANAIERDGEHVGEHLRIGGGVAHAEIHGAGDDGDHAIGVEMHGAEFLAAAGSDFQIAADADAAQKPALLAIALAPLEPVVIGELQRMLEHAGKVAAVVGHA